MEHGLGLGQLGQRFLARARQPLQPRMAQRGFDQHVRRAGAQRLQPAGQHLAGRVDAVLLVERRGHRHGTYAGGNRAPSVPLLRQRQHLPAQAQGFIGIPLLPRHQRHHGAAQQRQLGGAGLQRNAVRRARTRRLAQRRRAAQLQAHTDQFKLGIADGLAVQRVEQGLRARQVIALRGDGGAHHGGVPPGIDSLEGAAARRAGLP
ncbi:hypothetical protein D9M72_490570 [compost metagenome]